MPKQVVRPEIKEKFTLLYEVFISFQAPALEGKNSNQSVFVIHLHTKAEALV